MFQWSFVLLSTLLFRFFYCCWLPCSAIGVSSVSGIPSVTGFFWFFTSFILCCNRPHCWRLRRPCYGLYLCCCWRPYCCWRPFCDWHFLTFWRPSCCCCPGCCWRPCCCCLPALAGVSAVGNMCFCCITKNVTFRLPEYRTMTSACIRQIIFLL